MDAVVRINPSTLTKNTKLHEAVVKKLKNEPERFTDVMEVLKANISSNFIKRFAQTLQKTHAELLCQLTAQDSEEGSAGITHVKYYMHTLTLSYMLVELMGSIHRLVYAGFKCHQPPK